jgi:SAM-dependent methyltransferase
MPRIGSLLPAGSVLEIAPGFGRWTEFLLRFCNSYCGIDLSGLCVNNCRQRFSGRRNAEFFVNDGMSLAAVAGRRFDLVFSFDSLVHADLDAISHYVPQIIQLLAPRGVAFLHHSNLAAVPGVSYGHRSENVSAEIVGDLICCNGGHTLVQERFPWGDNLPTDCFSMFCWKGDYLSFETQDIADVNLVAVEGRTARERFQYYLNLR